MEKVVKKLSEIEAAAVAIIDSANARKKELSDAMDVKINTFDEQIDNETAKTLSDLKVKLEQQKDAELAELKANTEKTLNALDEEYAKNHTSLAKDLLNSIVGM